ncbi:MAG: ABC transporter permease [Candidatus Hydrothermarchaeales archaeon]
MIEPLGLYAMWTREVKVFTREKSRIVSSIFTPLLWLFVFGVGIGSFATVGEYDYQTYIFPGIICMSVLFTSVFFGVYIVWDRKIDFLKEVLVSPLSRVTIFFGKVIGGTTDSMIQATIILLLGPLLDIHYSPTSILLSMILIFVLTVGLVSIGLTLGSMMESPEGFGLIVSFVVFPLFFLSGALFPIDNLPSWLLPLVLADPVTYGVDGLRHLLIGTSRFSLLTDFFVLILFSTVMVLIGSKAFERMTI